MIILRYIVVIIFIQILFTSCKKIISYPFSSASELTFDTVFESFWNQMNTNYVYWDIDTV